MSDLKIGEGLEQKIISRLKDELEITHQIILISKIFHLEKIKKKEFSKNWKKMEEKMMELK